MTSILALCLFFLLSGSAFSQSEEEPAFTITDKTAKGFHAGIYLGSLFANKYTAELYDGYGYDTIGVKNNFLKSFMRQRILFDYGGGNGQPDQIAQALGVNPGDWIFDETDMPKEMKYNPAVAVGLHLMYSFDKKNSILLNATAVRLTATGLFTIVLNVNPIGAQQPSYENIQYFSITGSEQRTLVQLGYQHVFAGESPVNCFLEGGPTLNTARLTRNLATINNLHIDLSSYYTNPYYSTYRAKYLSGVGAGAFAGLGLNYHVNRKCRIQALYNASYEKINISVQPELKFQHAVGLRVYYHL